MQIIEKKMKTQSILGLIEKYRFSATATMHLLSNAKVSDPIPCADRDVQAFLKSLIDGAESARLVISDIEWEERGNCTGDELYPVRLSAVRLPDGRYFIEISGYEIDEQWVYCC